MPDCPNADLRDLLPDYAHGALTTAERAHVDAHLAACAACRDELALLRAVRAMRPTPAVPDVARIVAALPRPSVPAEHAARDVVALDTRRRRGARGLPWRRIAGIAAVLVGVVGIGLFGRRGESENRNAPTVVPAKSRMWPAVQRGRAPPRRPRRARVPSWPRSRTARLPPARRGRARGVGRPKPPTRSVRWAASRAARRRTSSRR